ncbi:MAG: cyanophycinase [Pirellulaceae bacterium]|nr:hypothetical protein [Planctomycetota bacterium]
MRLSDLFSTVNPMKSAICVGFCVLCLQTVPSAEDTIGPPQGTLVVVGGDDHPLVVVPGSTSRDGRHVDRRNLYRWAWLQRGHRPQTIAPVTLDSRQLESRGPDRGILFISGGGNRTAASTEHDVNVRYPAFVDLIREARSTVKPNIVVITTAGGRDRKGKHAATLVLNDLVGSANVTELFTLSRDVANSDEFLNPISQADGIWLGGGQQGLLANTFLDTGTEQALRSVLARGGVIGGSSAGAQFQSSFMTRGMNRNGRTGPILGDGDHQKGMGFITLTAFDVHVAARNRENDLFKLLATSRGQLHDRNLDPTQLLGIGIDELTAIIVRKDQFKVIGEGQVYVYNPPEWKNGVEPFYDTLSTGDRFNIRMRKTLVRNRDLSIDERAHENGTTKPKKGLPRSSENNR